MEVRGIGSIKSNVPRIRVVQGIGKITLRNPLTAIKEGFEKVVDVIKDGAEWTGDKLKDGAEAAKQGTKVVALFPARAAFVGLLKLNFRGFATRLHRMDDLSNIESNWKKLGGAWGDFNAAINNGWDKPYLFGVKKGEGSRDESDEDLVKSAVVVFRDTNGVALDQAVFDTANYNIPGMLPGNNNGTGIYIGSAAAIAGYLLAAAPILAIVVPLIAQSKENKIQDKIENGVNVTLLERENLWKVQAAEEGLLARQKALSEGKSQTEAFTIGTKATNDAFKRLRAEYEGEQLTKQDALKFDAESNSAFGINFGALLKQYWPVAALLAAAVVAPKIFKSK